MLFAVDTKWGGGKDQDSNVDEAERRLLERNERYLCYFGFIRVKQIAVQCDFSCVGFSHMLIMHVKLYEYATMKWKRSFNLNLQWH